MSIRRAITLASTLALTTLTSLALPVMPAGAHSTRELVASFGSFEEVGGLAVDLETGNIYASDKKTGTVDIFGATGGVPTDGVPSQITGLHFKPYFKPSGVAVDNSCFEHEPRLTGSACEEYDPSYGDLYVVGQDSESEGIQKFKLSPGHGYELADNIRLPGPSAAGVTVDSRGNVYEIEEEEHSSILEFKKTIERVTNSGMEEFKEKLEEVRTPQNLVQRRPAYVAVDDIGDIYISDSWELGSREGFHGVGKLRVDSAGNVISEEIFTGNLSGTLRPVAVDRTTGVVYVGDGSEIAEYNSVGALQLKFGSTEPLGGSLSKTEGSGAKAIAVNSGTGFVYVANPLHGDVDVFGPVVGLPVIEAQQPAASTISRTSALITGTADPESGQAATYHFEYVDAAEYEPTAAEPYRAGGETAEGSLPGGHAAESTEEVALTGLRPGRTYHYRLVVSNATGTTYGPDETLTTTPATPPVVGTGPAGEVTATSAMLAGMVEPRGLSTSYVFEVGTDTSYGGARLFGDAGSSTGEVPISVVLQYLVPGTVYHYRLVATSFDGTSYGQDGTFTTPGVPSSIGQPPSTPLITSPTVQFPSIAGAITEPASSAKAKGKRKAKTKIKQHRRQRKGKAKRKARKTARARRH